MVRLSSYVAGQWFEGQGPGVSLVNPATEERLATIAKATPTITTLPQASIDKKDEKIRVLSVAIDRNGRYVLNGTPIPFTTAADLASRMKAAAPGQKPPVVAISAALEAQIADLSDEDKQMFLDDMGMTEPGAGTDVLGMGTVGEDGGDEGGEGASLPSGEYPVVRGLSWLRHGRIMPHGGASRTEWRNAAVGSRHWRVAKR